MILHLPLLLVLALGDLSWPNREAAHGWLLEVGLAARDVVEAAAASSDPEVAWRSARVLPYLPWSDVATHDVAAGLGMDRAALLEALARGGGELSPAFAGRTAPEVWPLVRRILAVGPDRLAEVVHCRMDLVAARAALKSGGAWIEVCSQQLGSASPGMRTVAEALLLDAGPAAIRAVGRAARSGDAEVASRARTLLPLLPWSDVFPDPLARSTGADRRCFLEALAAGDASALPEAFGEDPAYERPVLALVERVLSVGPPAARGWWIRDLFERPWAVPVEARPGLERALGAAAGRGFRRALGDELLVDGPSWWRKRVRGALHDLWRGGPQRTIFARDVLAGMGSLAIPSVVAELERLDLSRAKDRADASVLEQVLAAARGGRDLGLAIEARRIDVDLERLETIRRQWVAWYEDPGG